MPEDTFTPNLTPHSDVDESLAVAEVASTFIGQPWLFGSDDTPEDKAQARVLTLMTVTPPNVAHCRSLRKGMTGGDVRGHKRAWSRAFPDLYPWPDDGFTPLFGEFFDEAVRKGQKRMGLVVDGQIGPATHEALERRGRKGHPGEWAFDATAIILCRDYCRQLTDPTLRIRRRFAEFALSTVMRDPSIGYSQRRPFTSWSDLLDGDYSVIDCSGYVTRACEYAGVRNPNVAGGMRLSYGSGLGYTGTLVAGTRPTTLRDLEVGDLVMYGFTFSSSPAFPYGSPTHVAYVHDLDPLLVATMGSSSDPSSRPLFYRPVNRYAPFRKVLL